MANRQPIFPVIRSHSSGRINLVLPYAAESDEFAGCTKLLWPD